MKKGEITTQQIVLLIILLVSFVVILFLLFRLELGKQSDAEICHNSVVMRSTPLPEGATPLKCSRAYVCLSKDNTCEAMANSEIIKVKTKEDVYNALAEEMADCWWMFGEGKIDYVGKDLKENLYCSICTQLVLDNSVGEIEGIQGKIDQRDFYSSLEKMQMPDKETSYLEYLTGYATFSSFQSAIGSKGVTFGSFEFNKPYFVMMGINSVVGTWKWIAVGAAVAGVIAIPFTGGISSTAISALIIGGAATGGGVGGHFIGTTVKGDGVDNEFLKPVIVEANADTFKKFGCKDILTST